MKGNQHFTMTGFHPDAGVAGDVLVGGDGAGEGAVGVEDGPAGEVFFLVFVEVVFRIDGGTGKFLGIPEGADAGQADEGAGGTPLREVKFSVSDRSDFE